MQMSELMMSLPHSFLLIVFTKMTKIPYFSYKKVKLAFVISTLSKCKMFADDLLKIKKFVILYIPYFVSHFKQICTVLFVCFLLFLIN